jgi:hypothetical protein
MNKSFLVLFFKKEPEKALLFEKRSKNFCSLVDALIVYSHQRKQR